MLNMRAGRRSRANQPALGTGGFNPG